MHKLAHLQGNYDVFNLGTGSGFSVLQVVKGFEKAMGRPLSYSFTERRHGDVPKLVANVEKASAQLGWKVTKNLDNMCEDSVRFITRRFEQKK